MPKYTRKALEVEAVQFTGENLPDVLDFYLKRTDYPVFSYLNDNAGAHYEHWHVDMALKVGGLHIKNLTT